MKKTMTLLVAALMLSATALAKDLKVLVMKTAPEMHCDKCETRIKGDLRFVPGVKRIETDLSTKLVTVTFDAEKTGRKEILAALKKLGFEGSVVSEGAAPPKSSGQKPVDATSGATQQKKK